MMDLFKELADRMKELGLVRDKPYAEPLAPDFHAELNAKLQPKPVPIPEPKTDWYSGC